VTAEPLLSVRALSVRFALGGALFARPRLLTALDQVSFDLAAGETLGVVGESGCGKSTLGRAILRLVEPSEGAVLWQGSDLGQLDAARLRALRRHMQMIFQDPLAALDPRMSIAQIVAEPLKSFRPELGRTEQAELVRAMLLRVGLAPEHARRYPHEFSGGQCQRIGIARAMMLAPKLVICDEPVSALDMSIQAQIVNLLVALQTEMGLSLIFISHNLAIVRHVSHRIAVLYLGRLVELGPAEAIFGTPRHPYTRALIAAVPVADPVRERRRAKLPVTGEPPSPLDPPSGCAFRTRCPFATDICAAVRPELEGDAHSVACHHWEKIAAELTPPIDSASPG
jgi:oligopeptide transport system ATP-binding protein